MRRFLLLVPLLSSCEWSTEPALPSRAERFTPPSVYQLWWNLAQQCSGISGDFSAVTWYRVPGAGEIPLGDGSLVNGRWDPLENRIVLAGDDQWDGDLVRHEMLHALIKSAGHPRSFFIGRCGGTVVCTGKCISDGGPAPQPDPAAVVVSPSALKIGVYVSPTAPSSMVNDGTMMLYVTARNSSANSVIVQLPASGDAGPSGSFSFDFEEGSRSWWYDMRAEVPEVTRFAPGELKRFIFDFRIGTGDTRYTIAPGTYKFSGAYGGVWATYPAPVTISP